jgi:hypothetical protein
MVEAQEQAIEQYKADADRIATRIAVVGQKRDTYKRTKDARLYDAQQKLYALESMLGDAVSELELRGVNTKKWNVFFKLV